MTIIGYSIIVFAKIIHFLLNLYTFIIAAAVILSWVRADPAHPLVRIIARITEPVLGRVRRIMPQAMFRTGIDLSPMIVLLILILIDSILVGILMEAGRALLTKGA